MNYLKTLSDKDVFPSKNFSHVSNWTTRKTVKIILLSEENKIALITNPTHKCFLLPGGGIEKGEDLYVAADRESQEEANYSIEPIAIIGVIEEYRARDGKRYETYGVLAKAKEMIKEDRRTEEEKKNIVTSGWYSIEETRHLFKQQVELLETGQIDFYNTGFNIVRDALFFKTAQKKKLL